MFIPLTDIHIFVLPVDAGHVISKFTLWSTQFTTKFNILVD